MHRVSLLALSLATACATASCINLDPFLFAPTLAVDDMDLMETATDVPSKLVTELFGEIVTADGVAVDAYLLSHDATDGTPVERHKTGILYCHGNSTNISGYALRAQALWQQGYTVLIFDYRGYGKTKGKPTEQGLYNDGRAARDYMYSPTGLGMSPERVAFYGWSLGAAICTQMAVEAQPPALLLEAPFASVAELISDGASLDLPRPWFADGQFDNRGKINQFGRSLFVMHGDKDMFVQQKYGREIYNASVGHAQPAAFWSVPGAGHDTVPCTDPSLPAPNHGGCTEGFTQTYFDQVTGVIDAAIAPTGTF